MGQGGRRGVSHCWARRACNEKGRIKGGGQLGGYGPDRGGGSHCRAGRACNDTGKVKGRAGGGGGKPQQPLTCAPPHLNCRLWAEAPPLPAHWSRGLPLPRRHWLRVTPVKSPGPLEPVSHKRSDRPSELLGEEKIDWALLLAQKFLPIKPLRTGLVFQAVHLPSRVAGGWEDPGMGQAQRYRPLAAFKLVAPDRFQPAQVARSQRGIESSRPAVEGR